MPQTADSLYSRILDPRCLARGAVRGEIEGLQINPVPRPDRFWVARFEPSGDPCVLNAPHWGATRGRSWRVVRSFRAILPRTADGESGQRLLFVALGANVRDAMLFLVEAPPPLPTLDALLQAWPTEAKGLFVGRRTLTRARLAVGDRRFDRSCLVNGPVHLAVSTPPGWRIPARKAWLWAFKQVRLGLPAEKAVRWLAAARDERDLRALEVMAALASA